MIIGNPVRGPTLENVPMKIQLIPNVGHTWDRIAVTL
jgi:hypothetical protein